MQNKHTRDTYGRFIKGIAYSLSTQFKKGQIPWNKGQKGVAMRSNATKKKISSSTLGKTKPWLIGRKLSEEHKRKIRLANLGKKHTEESKRKMSLNGIGKKWSNESKKRFSENYRGEKASNWKGGKITTFCKICGESFLVFPYQIKRGGGKFCSLHCASSAPKPAIKKLWENKEWCEKQHQVMLKGLLIRPTSLEEQMIRIIQKHHLPYKYTGNGDFWIGGKNPDFVNINGKKILIEVGNVYHHQGDYIEKRRDHFAQYGWKSFIFIQDKLNEQEILDQIT